MIAGVTKTFAGLAGLVFMLLMISQFIAYFNYTNLPRVAAVEMAHFLEQANIGGLAFLVGFILVIVILDFILPGVVPKWAIFAPVFIPIFARLGVSPQTVLAAYRVGDSPVNVITPLMVYLPFIVTIAQRYKKDAGHRDRRGVDDPLCAGPAHRLDAALHGLVLARDPARPRVPGQHLGNDRVRCRHRLPGAGGSRRALHLEPAAGGVGRGRGGSDPRRHRASSPSTSRWLGSATPP